MTVKRDASERTVEIALIQEVRRAGGIAEKTISPSGRGYFDRVVVLPGGRVIFCELKRNDGGVLSPHQIQRHEHYRALGAEVAVLCDFSDIDKLLSR